MLKPLKIAIVGCEESSWKQEQAFIAKQTIKNIFLDNLSEYEKRRYPTKKLTSVKLISGHCPRGGVDIWAEKIADELGIQKEIYAPEMYSDGNYYWEDKVKYRWHCGDPMCTQREKIVVKGFRTRNIQIAEACDKLYCVVPAVDSTCLHCGVSGHPTNGGCWTMKYAKKLGKETFLRVIETSNQNKNDEKIFELSLRRWGKDKQLAMLAEEAGELAVAALHLIRGRDHALEEFAEEIADVELLIAEMKYLFPLLPELVDKFRAQKIERLEKILEGE